MPLEALEKSHVPVVCILKLKLTKALAPLPYPNTAFSPLGTITFNLEAYVEWIYTDKKTFEILDFVNGGPFNLHLFCSYL